MYICVNYWGQFPVLVDGHDPSLLKYPQGENQSKRHHSLVLHGISLADIRTFLRFWTVIVEFIQEYVNLQHINLLKLIECINGDNDNISTRTPGWLLFVKNGHVRDSQVNRWVVQQIRFRTFAPFSYTRMVTLKMASYYVMGHRCLHENFKGSLNSTWADSLKYIAIEESLLS